MNHRDIAALMAGLAPVIRDYVVDTCKGFGDRLTRLEQRVPERGEKGEPGKDVDLETLAKLVAAEVEKVVAALPKPADGKSIEPAEVRLMVAEEVAKIPPPQDGKSVTVDDVRPVIEQAVGNAVKEIPVPKDGVGLAGAVIDRDGNLVVTLTDGAHCKLGTVVGKDGEPGKPGRDGLGFEDFEETVEDGGRVFVRRYRRGDEVKEFRLVTATPVDRGVWREGKYLKGDAVTFGGSWFVAQVDTESKPESDATWRLAAKRGRDGRDGKPGERGLQGAKGDPGRDGKQW